MTYIGFAPYEPQPENVDLIENVQHVLLEYQEYLPLTLRQIFYRLVGSRGYDKTETAYKRLGNVLARARRARLIRFNAIRDDGLTVNSPASFSGAGDFIQAVMHSARRYRRDRQEGQRTRIIVACEASGMVPQLVRVCEPYGISVRSSGGFDSVTAKHDLATDIVDRLVDTKLFHVGDYDPSGVHLYLNLEADVGRFVRELSIQEYDDAGAVSFSVQRVAVT